MNERESIRKNKRILTVATLVPVIALFCWILLNSTLNHTGIHFHYVYSGKTGEPLSFVTSVLLYLLCWWFIGLLPSSVLFFYQLCIFDFLHRKDPPVTFQYPLPKYMDEFHYGGGIAFLSMYGMILILMLLHITNIATIDVPFYD